MAIAKPSLLMPNSLLGEREDATFAAWLMLRGGRHRYVRQLPADVCARLPRRAFPRTAKVHAAMVRARAATEKSQIEFFRMVFAPRRGTFLCAVQARFPFQRQVHSWASLI